MSVLCAAEDSQTGQLSVSQLVLLEHALDGHGHGQFGLLFHQGLVLGLVQAAHPAGVTAVVLLLQLLAGQNSLVGVDDDDIITAVDIGSVGDFILAAQQISGGNSSLAQGLACCIQDIPFAFDGSLGSQCCGHIRCLHYNDKYFDNYWAHAYNNHESCLTFIT